MSGRDDRNEDEEDPRAGWAPEVPDPSATVPGTSRSHFPGDDPSAFDPYPTAQMYRRELLMRPIVDEVAEEEAKQRAAGVTVDPEALPRTESWSWKEREKKRAPRPTPGARHAFVRMIAQPVVAGTFAALAATVFLALFVFAIFLYVAG